jgi:hypothetical protein
LVDEGSGAISYNNRIGYLQPKQVDIVLALMAAWPNGLSDEELIKAAWGKRPPEEAGKALAVHICIINRVVRGWGVEILKGNGVRSIRYAWSRA